MTDFLLQAALSFSPAEGDAPRRFTMEAYDGGLLRLPNFPTPVVVDLSGMQAVDQVKALLYHDAARPAGHMDQVEIGDRIRTGGVLSHPVNSAEILAAQRNGFEWEASIGATIVDGAKEFVPAGRRVRVNGREFSGPVLVARKTLLREVSFTGAGAGMNTNARIAAQALPYLEPSMEPTPPAGEKTPTPPTPPAVPDFSKELGEIRDLRASLTSEIDALKKDRERLNAETERLQRERLVGHVDRIVAQYGATSDEKILAELREKAQSGGITESEIELAVIRASMANHKLDGFRTVGGKRGAPADQQVIEAALCLTSGWSEQELADRKHFDEKTINAALEPRFQGFGVRSLAIEHLQSHGHQVLGGRLQDEDIQAAIHFAEQDQIQAAGGFSTISLPGILSNVARKEMLRAFDAFVKAIITIAKRSTATDYKPYFMYRVSTGALLEQVGADGELKSMELSEDEFQARVYPFGRKLAITSVMLKNDDMGAFNDLARLFGLTASRTLEVMGFRTLLSQQSTFWTTVKGNRVAPGGGSALGIDSLGTAYQLFLESKDFTGQPIGILPKYLLTAPRDAVKAGQLFTDTHVNLAAAGDSDVVVERTSGNPWRGMFQPLHSPYLAASMVPNANGTQWLLLPDPTITSPLVVSYLDGRATPQVKHWEAIPGRMGMQWDLTFSFGFNLHDDTGSVYSPGQ